MRPAAHFYVSDGSGDPRLRGAGRLRPRRGHADAARRGARGAGRDGRFHRPVLGRERDLARARHRAPARRLPDRARRDPRRAVPAGGGDAGRADAARRGVRAAHQGRGLAPGAVELALLGRLDDRELRARAHARALHHRLRAGPGHVGVRAARSARRSAAATCCSARPGSCSGPRASCSKRRWPGRAGAWGGWRSASPSSAWPRRSRARRCACAGSTSRAPWDSWCCPQRRLLHGMVGLEKPWPFRREALRRRGVDLRARLHRPRLQPVPLRGDGPDDHLGRRRAPERARLHAGRNARSCCRSSSATPSTPTGCSAARPAPRTTGTARPPSCPKYSSRSSSSG